MRILTPSRVVKNDFLLRISIVCLQLRWRRRKNPQRIAEDTSAVFSSSPPRFVKTLKMLTTEPFFTTLLEKAPRFSYLQGMSSDNYPLRGSPRPKPFSKETPYGHRFAAHQLVDQQVEAAVRELRERFESAEASPGDRKPAGEAIRCAWRCLTVAGFPDFDAIREVRTEEWPEMIPANQHNLISLALEIIGWYQFGIRPYDIDRTARLFDRCLELTPHNPRALERFAIVANTIQPHHIAGLAKFPKKQQETALGYRLQCKRKIDNILLEVFGISESHLVGQAEATVATIARSRKDRERSFIFEILGHLSRINLAVGEFFGNGTQLSLGIGAACCQLEMLDLPRDLSNTVTLLRGRLEEESSGDIAGEETDLLCIVLEAIADLCESKWRVFKNHASQRRSAELRQLLKDIADKRGSHASPVD